MEDLSAWAGPAVPPSPEDLANRYAIEQLAKIYALGLDSKNYALARSAFADDGIGIGRNGPEPIDDYLTSTYNVATSFHATQHFIGNQYVKLDGDEAVLWSYAIAHHKRAPGDAADEIIAAVQYRDKCRRSPKGWLITERAVEMMWMDMAPTRTPARA